MTEPTDNPTPLTEETGETKKPARRRAPRASKAAAKKSADPAGQPDADETAPEQTAPGDPIAQTANGAASATAEPESKPAEPESKSAEPDSKPAPAEPAHAAVPAHSAAAQQAAAPQAAPAQTGTQPPAYTPRVTVVQEAQRPAPPPQEPQFGEGIIEVSGKGFGFLRDAKRNFVQNPQDIFVPPEVVRRWCLRDGMWVRGEIRRGGRGPQLFRLLQINNDDPEKYQNLPVFEELTTINPSEPVRLETVPERATTRVMDMMTPIGKGQRGLIVAPPRTGKTTLLHHIADAVTKNHPEMLTIILLVDERPEEVTDFRRNHPTCELMASSNDMDVKSHTRISVLAIERAKRLVEAGRDVFILLDSITRVARSFNNALGGGGRTMSGGIDSRAMEVPRKIFAAARNTEEAGSLTIMATALIETGSRMDDLIFQEFKGTGNMELVLARNIADMRVYPAVDIFLSGTRREELLIPADKLHKINMIRRGLAGHKPIEAIERLLMFVKKFPTNEQMLREIPG
jgi:transcription termination factor Rho